MINAVGKKLGKLKINGIKMNFPLKISLLYLNKSAVSTDHKLR